MKLPHGWETVEEKIHKVFTFRNFTEAFAFMNRVAIVAEEMNHHPEWTNTYNEVSVFLTTHDAGMITEADITLAEAMNELA